MAGYAFGNGLMLDPAEEFRAGGERGRQSRLRDLMGQAATADPEQRGSLLGQIMATDYETGFKAQKAFGESDDDAFDAITRTASMMVSAPPQLRQSLYPRLVQATRRVMPQAQFPEAWDETQLPHIEQLARMRVKVETPTSVQEYQYAQSNPGYLAYRRALAEASARPQYGNINGTPIEFGPGGYTPVGPAGAVPQQAAPDGGQQVMDGAYNDAQLNPVTDFQSLAQLPGVQVSSLARDPRRNSKVGGVENSYHLTGEAGDFVVPQAQKQAFIQRARSMGYEAIDEGDHVHVEPPRRGMTASRFVPGQSVAAAPGDQPDILSQSQPPITASEKVKAAWPFLTPQQRQQMIQQDAGLIQDPKPQMLSDAEVAREGLPKGTKAYRDKDGIIKTTYTPPASVQGGAKPMPVKIVQELLEIDSAIGASQQAATALKTHADRMVDGDLVVGPEDELGRRVRTFAGMANKNDVNLSEFKADITRTVNEWLRLNKGVQTEGDAQREFKAVMDSNDPDTAARAVARLARIIKNTVQIQQRKRATIFSNYGRGQPAPAQQGAPGGGWGIQRVGD